jgi:hypothetical protein
MACHGAMQATHKNAITGVQIAGIRKLGVSMLLSAEQACGRETGA